MNPYSDCRISVSVAYQVLVVETLFRNPGPVTTKSGIPARWFSVARQIEALFNVRTRLRRAFRYTMALLKFFGFFLASPAVLAFTTCQSTIITRSYIHPSLVPHLPWAVNNTQPILSSGTSIHPGWSGGLTQATLATNTASGTSTALRSLRPTETVTVGDAGKLVFSPSSLNASVGSVIAFNFLGSNHSLTQSELFNPCQSNGGFDTGFKQFNPTNVSGRFVVEIEVVSGHPKWYFCAQNVRKSHCEAGMVFSLNPGGKHSQFLSNALAAIDTTSGIPDIACQLPTLAPTHNISTISPTGTVSARVGATSAAILPPISNIGSTIRASTFGLLLIFAFM